MKTKITIEIETTKFRPLYETIDYDDDTGEETYGDVVYTEKAFHNQMLRLIKRKMEIEELTDWFEDVLPDEWDSVDEFASPLKITIKQEVIEK